MNIRITVRLRVNVRVKGQESGLGLLLGVKVGVRIRLCVRVRVRVRVRNSVSHYFISMTLDHYPLQIPVNRSSVMSPPNPRSSSGVGNALRWT